MPSAIEQSIPMHHCSWPWTNLPTVDMSIRPEQMLETVQPFTVSDLIKPIIHLPPVRADRPLIIVHSIIDPSILSAIKAIWISPIFLPFTQHSRFWYWVHTGAIALFVHSLHTVLTLCRRSDTGVYVMPSDIYCTSTGLRHLFSCGPLGIDAHMFKHE